MLTDRLKGLERQRTVSPPKSGGLRIEDGSVVSSGPRAPKKRSAQALDRRRNLDVCEGVNGPENEDGNPMLIIRSSRRGVAERAKKAPLSCGPSRRTHIKSRAMYGEKPESCGATRNFPGPGCNRSWFSSLFIYRYS